MMPIASLETPQVILSPWVANKEQRRQQAIRLVSHFCHKWFDRDGRWVHPVGIDSRGHWVNPPQILPPTYTRLVFWLTMGLLDGTEQDVALSNAILRTTFYSPGGRADEIDEQSPPFSIFVTNHSMQMLALHGSKLDGDVREKVENWARVGLQVVGADHRCDYQFKGFNDNMPAKATLGLILGGEYFKDTEGLEHGIWNLRQLADLLTRRGLISEYNSPTYIPFTIVNLAVIARCAQDPCASALASQCVDRLWADILAHYHQPTGLMGGPFSRAYYFDSTAHLSSMSFLLWLARGTRVFPNPMEEFSREPIRLLHAHGFMPESLSRLSWIASCPLTPPAELAAWSESRQYPFRFRATTERGGSGEGGPAEVAVTQYQTEDFSLGTADGESWSLRQSEVFYLTYRRRRPAEGIEDVRVAFTRYLINEEAPCDPSQELKTHGLVRTLQSGPTTLVLARPGLSLASVPMARMRFCFMLPIHFGAVGHVVSEDGHVFIEDGTVRMAVTPLNPSSWGGGRSLSVEQVDNYLMVSLYNYEGEPRTFTTEELGRTLNGFAFTIEAIDNGTMQGFKERIRASRYVDNFSFGNREVRYQLGRTILAMAYCPESDRVRYRSINGKLMPTPVWEADGLPMERLPFLDGQHIPNAIGVPFTTMDSGPYKDPHWCLCQKNAEFGRPELWAFEGEGWLT